MDAFLRRVIARREREQERELLFRREERPTCIFCGRALNKFDDGNTPLRVCTPCGGRKRQERFEKGRA